MDINYPRQWMLCIGTTFDGDAQYRLGFLDSDVQVAVMVGHHSRRPPVVHVRVVPQSLHRLMSSDPSSFF